MYTLFDEMIILSGSRRDKPKSCYERMQFLLKIIVHILCYNIATNYMQNNNKGVGSVMS